jgi:hypothetical protein
MRSEPPPPPFEPLPLGKRDLELTMKPGMRTLPPEVVDEMQGRRHAMLDRFEVHNPRFRRRLKNYVIGAAICYPLVTALLTPVGFGWFPLQIVIGALYGVVVAYTRATGVMAGLIGAAFGMATLWVCGPPVVTYLALICTLLFYLVMGFAIGAQEYMKAQDGE